jgi:CPA2 family monovalent cation:H+ antiporter-2
VEDFTLVTTISLVLGVAIISGLVARRLGQPVILGYIVAGVLIGPNTPGAIADRGSVELLANLGVAFMMFALGLEVSLAELMRVRRVAVFAGTMQVILTAALGATLGVAIGWSVPSAILLGSAFAISSSIVAIKLLSGRGEMESPQGRLAIGVGVVQDLAVVPILALVPLLAGTRENLAVELVRSIGMAALALAAVILVGSRLVPSVLFTLARTGSRELFLMTVVVIALGTGLASQRSGLSFALGAYLAGLVVAESEFEGQVLAQIIPLRDLFASVFFVAVGMLIDPVFLLAHLGPVVLLVVALVFGKLTLTAGALMIAGADDRAAALAGGVLAQMGEFSFVIAGLGSAIGIVSLDQYGLILAVALTSIVVVAPLLSVMPRLMNVAERWRPLARRRVRAPHDEPNLPPIRSDVVICGYGRVGRDVGLIIGDAGFTFTVIDLDSVEVRELRERGIRAYYGDAGSEPVLIRAGIEHARILALAAPDLIAASQAVRIARRLNPDVWVIALAAANEAIEAFAATGANAVVQPELETSLGFSRQMLRWLGVSATDTRMVVASERDALYGRDRKTTTRAKRRQRRRDRPDAPLVEKQPVAEPCDQTVTGRTDLAIP